VLSDQTLDNLRWPPICAVLIGAAFQCCDDVEIFFQASKCARAAGRCAPVF
jgi:hypothetical protein